MLVEPSAVVLIDASAMCGRAPTTGSAGVTGSERAMGPLVLAKDED